MTVVWLRHGGSRGCYWEPSHHIPHIFPNPYSPCFNTVGMIADAMHVRAHGTAVHAPPQWHYILLRTSLISYVFYNGHLFLIYIVWLIWGTLLSLDVRNRRHPGLSIDFSCVWLAPERKEITKRCSFFHGSQEDIAKRPKSIINP